MQIRFLQSVYLSYQIPLSQNLRVPSHVVRISLHPSPEVYMYIDTPVLITTRSVLSMFKGQSLMVCWRLTLITNIPICHPYCAGQAYAEGNRFIYLFISFMFYSKIFQIYHGSQHYGGRIPSKVLPERPYQVRPDRKQQELGLNPKRQQWEETPGCSDALIN